VEGGGPPFAYFISNKKRFFGSLRLQRLVLSHNRKEATMHHQYQMTDQMKECIAACWSCAQICNQCGDDMIGMEPHGHSMELMARCIRLCRECADICTLSAQWMSRLSRFSENLCRLCADICDVCAEVCEEHAPHHELCGPCAKECRRCARLCREMAGARAA
jgi:hypothetical protein